MVYLQCDKVVEINFISCNDEIPDTFETEVLKF